MGCGVIDGQEGVSNISNAASVQNMGYLIQVIANGRELVGHLLQGNNKSIMSAFCSDNSQHHRPQP